MEMRKIDSADTSSQEFYSLVLRGVCALPTRVLHNSISYLISELGLTNFVTPKTTSYYYTFFNLVQ